MTKFTPPTEFPHECLTVYGETITLFAVDSNNRYAGLCHKEDGPTLADIYKPEILRNISEVTSTWQNVYPSGFGLQDGTRETADRNATKNRIAVLRRDTVDGVTTCTLDDG